MLQDEEGYKSTAWNHYDCFWKHPETKKLDGIHEIHNFTKLKAEDRAKITAAFNEFNANKMTTKKKGKTTSKKRNNNDSDDEDFSSKSESTPKKLTKKEPASKKRKRALTEEED
ncbi:unnamed protein product [Rotaria sordida]|uniref:PARP-type domain-containing protein n=1 Tax=Rotaria sordida TaxID=392033 RepID=A0A815VPM2_9BILA|nr:unnamed protein product [Rotaria sordida]CAF1530455.1 unnamed protein product [Rotaria sordida]CAF1530912.1 unnamed protein product [Rotaria sordida]